MKGDFTGFKINGIHSSELGITRIADGDRYDETLIPDLEDKTVEIPGNDGSYYYGSYFKPREFKINVAFDHLTNPQFRRLRQLTSNRRLFPLVFDEAPYKVYMVKASAPPEFHYICFDETKVTYSSTGQEDYIDGSIDHIDHSSNQSEMIYKGEGDLTFTAYNPFGYAPHKTLNEYKEEYDNVDEWAETSGLKETLSGYDKSEKYRKYSTKEEDNPQELGLYVLNNEEYVLTTDTNPVDGIIYYKMYGDREIQVYNPGDISTPFKLYIPFDNNDIVPKLTIELKNVEGARLQLEEVAKETGSAVDPTGIVINTKNGLVEGAVKNQTSGKITIYSTMLYNQYATVGNFFRIPTGAEGAPFTGVLNISEDITGIEIDYDYLYF